MTVSPGDTVRHLAWPLTFTGQAIHVHDNQAWVRWSWGRHALVPSSALAVV